MTTSAIEEAINFLRHVLAKPVRSSEVRQLGRAQGHSWRTLERAGKVLGVKAGKRGAVWYWRLDDSSPPMNIATKRANSANQGRQPRPPTARTYEPLELCEVAVQTLEQHLKHVDDGVGLGQLLSRMSRLCYILGPHARARPLVRCDECRFHGQIQGSYCPIGRIYVGPRYARRSCNQFVWPDTEACV
jgi:hypothetical protein